MFGLVTLILTVRVLIIGLKIQLGIYTFIIHITVPYPQIPECATIILYCYINTYFFLKKKTYKNLIHLGTKMNIVVSLAHNYIASKLNDILKKLKRIYHKVWLSKV